MSAWKFWQQGKIHMLWPLADAKDLHRTCYQRGIRVGIHRGSLGDPVFPQGILFYGMLVNNTFGQGILAGNLPLV